jgi:hypothetical protein
MKLSRWLWWFLVVAVVQILIGSAELPISRLQGRLRSCARSRFAWLQLAPMLLTLGLAALTSRFATFIPGALSTAVWRATSAVFSNAAHVTPLKLAQERFLETMTTLNKEFEESIQARFVVTHGDEAQGMLKPGCAHEVFAVMERAVEGVLPVELRFGIGIAPGGAAPRSE